MKKIIKAWAVLLDEDIARLSKDAANFDDPMVQGLLCIKDWQQFRNMTPVTITYEIPEP